MRGRAIHPSAKSLCSAAAATALLAAICLPRPAVAHGPVVRKAPPPLVVTDSGRMDLLETAMAPEMHLAIFSKALTAAGLDGTLNGRGPFTVLAPTDEAFAKLPQGTLDDLLKPENREKLRAVLSYHILPGRYLARDFASNRSATTLNGKDLELQADGAKVTAGKATLLAADVTASNGVLHTIDRVLLP